MPPPGPYELELVTAVGPNDLWVTSRQMLHHWNGRRWTKAKLPLPDMHVDGLDNAESSIWIAGTDGDDREVVARYDGGTWSQAVRPTATLGPDYRGLAAVSDRSAWTIGVRHPAHAPAAQLACVGP